MAWQKQKSIQAGGGRFVDGYLAYLLAQASQRISAEFHLQVRAAGLSVTEWRVLASLEGSAGDHRHAGRAGHHQAAHAEQGGAAHGG